MEVKNEQKIIFKENGILFTSNTYSPNKTVYLDYCRSTIIRIHDKAVRWVIYLQGLRSSLGSQGVRGAGHWGGCRKVYPHPVGGGGFGRTPQKNLVNLGQL